MQAPAGNPAPRDPAIFPDVDDPGDATQRNFRYQHGYGVILLAAARRGDKPYVAIWCKHHEDLLAERSDGKYDGYQIKTSRPENGAWRMNDSEMVKSIGRFVELVQEFGDWIGDLFFVSNTEYDDCSGDHQDDKRRRPRAFLTHVKACTTHAEIADPYVATFLELQGECGCEPDELFVVLLRIDLLRGPARDSLPAVIAHEHLGRLPDCCSLEPARLDEFCDDLCAIIYRASSLAVTDPIRHLRPLIAGSGPDPTLVAKRLVVAEVIVCRSRNPQANNFRFPGPPRVQPAVRTRQPILREKLEHGDIGEQFDYLWGRERALEYNLLGEAEQSSEKVLEMLPQLEQVVLGECSEVHLRARAVGEPFGAAMMTAVQDRLRHLAEHEPKRVCHQPYDCLIGVMSSLTSDTRIWWSRRIPVQEPVA